MMTPRAWTSSQRGMPPLPVECRQVDLADQCPESKRVFQREEQTPVQTRNWLTGRGLRRSPPPAGHGRGCSGRRANSRTGVVSCRGRLAAEVSAIANGLQMNCDTLGCDASCSARMAAFGQEQSLGAPLQLFRALRLSTDRRSGSRPGRRRRTATKVAPGANGCWALPTLVGSATYSQHARHS